MIFTNPRPTRETVGYFYPEDYAPYQALFLPNVEIYNAGVTPLERIKNELKYWVLKNYFNYQKLEPARRLPALDRLPMWGKRLISRLSYIWFRKIYYRIPVWKESGRALDLGCGNGAYLLLLKKMGWDVIGVDMNDNVSREVKEAKIPVLTGELEELKLEENSFDLITLWHVLEHLHDPLKTLKLVHRLVKDDGILFVEVPNNTSALSRLFKSNWFAWDLPRHLCHFSPTSLSKMLNQAGFEITMIRHLSKNTLGKSIAYWLESLGIECDIDRIEKKRVFSYPLKRCGILLAFFRTSDIIFVEAKKEQIYVGSVNNYC
jgi:2-polyprenyl-3-methyl-5-hydroxy-6-metoxy-1,4-benzoquinol methylase